MRVVVPYFPNCLHPRVVPAIQAQGYEPTLLVCSNERGAVNTYPHYLRGLLLSSDDVCIIEHDNESRPGFLADLEACPEPWCFFAYDLYRPWDEHTSQAGGSQAQSVDFAALGHTRFRAGVGEDIRELLESRLFLSSWVARDTFISGALTAAGYVAHRHPGKCFHHHPYVRGVDAPPRDDIPVPRSRLHYP